MLVWHAVLDLFMAIFPEDWMTREQDDYRFTLRAIGMAAIEAVDPYELIVQTLALHANALVAGGETFELAADARLYLVGAGKAGFKMALAVVKVLQSRLIGAVVAVPEKPEEPIAGVEFIEGGHPFPTLGSIVAGEKIYELLERTRAQDLVIAIISGGGSALMELPVKGLDHKLLHKTNEVLLRSGASIEEINRVRTALSRIKGGGLLQMIHPARCIGLILSDVISNRLGAIASGPTIHQSPQAENALGVLRRHGIKDEIPRAVLRILQRGESKSIQYSSQPGFNILIGTVSTATRAAESFAKERGYRPLIVTNSLQGEARKVGRLIGALAKSVAGNMDLGDPPICLIFGGETTVKVSGSGLGGRNQELALAFVLEIEGCDQIALMTLATDGVDGPTPAAGAFANGNTVQKARGLGIDPWAALDENDSHTFFRGLGDVLVTGPTGTNVSDLIICVVTPPS